MVHRQCGARNMCTRTWKCTRGYVNTLASDRYHGKLRARFGHRVCLCAVSDTGRDQKVIRTRVLVTMPHLCVLQIYSMSLNVMQLID